MLSGTRLDTPHLRRRRDASSTLFREDGVSPHLAPLFLGFGTLNGVPPHLAPSFLGFGTLDAHWVDIAALRFVASSRLVLVALLLLLASSSRLILLVASSRFLVASSLILLVASSSRLLVASFRVLVASSVIILASSSRYVFPRHGAILRRMSFRGIGAILTLQERGRRASTRIQFHPGRPIAYASRPFS